MELFGRHHGRNDACSIAIPCDTGAWAQEGQASDKQAPAGASTAATVKPTAACAFCLEDGTKVPMTLGRELSSAKESTGNRVDFVVSEDVKVNDVMVIPKRFTGVRNNRGGAAQAPDGPRGQTECAHRGSAVSRWVAREIARHAGK